MGDLLHQPSFSAGEIGPELYGRIDQNLYYIGLRTCRNFIVRQYGGASNRPGTSFVAECKKPDNVTRLIPFQFNEIQTYMLEFGDQYMRVIRDGGEVLESAVNITAITGANPGVVTAASHGYSNGDDVFITGIVGMTELNGRNFRVANKTANTFELNDYQGNNIDTSGYTAYSSGGTTARVYTLTTPYLEADLYDLNFAQSNDVLTVVHPDYYPRDITRTAHTSWTISEFSNSQGPFRDINTDTSITVQSSGTTGSVTLTASSGIFDSTMVGELFYLEQKPNDTTTRWEVGKSISAVDIRRAGTHYYQAQTTGTTGTVRPSHIDGDDTDGDPGIRWRYIHSGFGILEITAYSSPTSVTATVIKQVPTYLTATGSHLWAKAAWSDNQGYPSAVAYHKQRLIFGGTVQQPNGLWMSGTGLRTFFGKSNPILDDEGITLKLDTTQVNAIRHLIPLSELIILTSATEQAVNGVDDLILATDPPVARTQGFTGSAKPVPIVIGTTALFIQDMGSTVRSLRYNLESDAFAGIDLSARSPHLFRSKTVVDWDFQRHPLSVIWLVMDNGDLNGFTFMDEQEVFAWHRHDTDGFFESVGCIREGNETAAYFVVRREINGNTTRYVERLASRYKNTVRDYVFMDSSLSYDGRNFTESLTGVKSATTSTTITITGGTTWDEPETLTLTASASLFSSTDVGDQIVFRYLNDDNIEIALRLEITAYTSATVVSAIPRKLVPTALRSTASLYWEFARDTFRPLDHIEGKEVAILSDGNIVEGKTVTNGAITLDTPGAVVHIGLPFTSQLETLDMAAPQSDPTKAKTLNIPRVFLTVQESRAVCVGINGFDSCREIKQRDPGLGYDAAIPAETTVFEVQIDTEWSRFGRIAIVQDKPLPVSILAISPEIELGYND